jgi:hypothetical protein
MTRRGSVGITTSVTGGVQIVLFSWYTYSRVVQSQRNRSSQGEHHMNAMPVFPKVDPQPILDLINQMGGECSFDDAMATLVKTGIAKSAARDAVWQLLSDGAIIFTADRRLKAPNSDLPTQKVG